MTTPAFDPSVARDLAHRVQRAVRTVCPVSFSADRDDLAQAALTRIVRRVRAGASPKTFTPAYVRTTARNAVRNAHRGRSRAPERADCDPGQSLAGPDTGDPEVRLHRHEIAAAIEDCLGALPVPRRDAVRSYLLGESVADIAVRNGWDRKRADNLVYRGLASLRRQLGARGVTAGTA